MGIVKEAVQFALDRFRARMIRQNAPRQFAACSDYQSPLPDCPHRFAGIAQTRQIDILLLPQIGIRVDKFLVLEAQFAVIIFAAAIGLIQCQILLDQIIVCTSEAFAFAFECRVGLRSAVAGAT